MELASLKPSFNAKVSPCTRNTGLRAMKIIVSDMTITVLSDWPDNQPACTVTKALIDSLIDRSIDQTIGWWIDWGFLSVWNTKWSRSIGVCDCSLLLLLQLDCWQFWNVGRDCVVPENIQACFFCLDSPPPRNSSYSTCMADTFPSIFRFWDPQSFWICNTLYLSWELIFSGTAQYSRQCWVIVDPQLSTAYRIAWFIDYNTFIILN